MQLRDVHIHGFRGIRDAAFKLSDYALLIGANNSGKSTAIAAILAFYEKDGFKFDLTRDVPKVGDDGESWIEVEFELPDPEWSSLKEEYQRSDRRLRLRKTWRTQGSAVKAPEIKVVAEDGGVSETSFYGAKNVQSGKLGEVIFIPAVSSIDEHTKLSGPSALRDLISNIISDVAQTSPAYVKLKGAYEEFGAELRSHSTPDSRSIQGMEDLVNESIDGWGVKLQILTNPPSDSELLKNSTKHAFVDECLPESLLGSDVYGSGFQRQVIYTLLRIKSDYSPAKKAAARKEFSPDFTLLLFEEPEAFLHPPQQDFMARELRKMSLGDGLQVCCSTHSSCFVSRSCDELGTLVRFRRETTGEINAYQLGDEAISCLNDAGRAMASIAEQHPNMKKKLHDDDLLPEMESVKYSLWLNRDRASMFFAGMVLIVEGASEVGLINRLVDDGHLQIPLDSRGIYVLDAMGKYNVHRYMELLSGLGIDHAVLIDDDDGNAEHADINELIRNSKNEDFTRGIATIRGDLERLLGIEKAGSPHRKPQHVLMQYESKAIAPENLSGLVGIISGCFIEHMAE